jgi:hypothetical protein
MAILLVVGLAAASTVSAMPRDPRLEKLAFTSADTLKAKNARLRLADLAVGWKGGPAPVDDGLPSELNPGAPIIGIETLARLVDERLLPAYAA